MRRIIALTATAITLTGLCTGCAESSTGSAGPAGPSGSSGSTATCAPGRLDTYSAGVLTVATDSPAYEPWFVDDKPTNGKGYESAVAYAVADRLGYPATSVRWTVASFNSVIAPAPKKYDFDVNEVSITADRAKVVAFSSGYYDVTQAVVSLTSGRYAKASSIAALKGAKLGAQKGSTSYLAIDAQIAPGTTAAEYPSNQLAIQALANGQIDALVVDLPTALEITADGEVKDGTIVGQLPVGSHPEQFGLVLDRQSPLTSCVSKAVDALRADGTLHRLQQQWLTTSAGAPELK